MADTQRVASNSSGTKGASGSGKGGNADGAEGGGKKSKKKLIIIAMVGLLVVGVGAKMTILKPKAKANAAAPALKAGKSVDLDEQTLNLADGHFLRIKVSVVLAEGVAVTAMADIQDADQAVIDEYSNKTVAELTGQAKRAAAAVELVTELKKAYPKVKIYGATYTEFLTQ